MPVPLWLAGSVTIVALVALGVFIYPLWLQQPLGRVLIALSTAALAVLFHWFDGGRTADPVWRMTFALAFALAPVVVGAIVARISRPGA